MSSQLTPSKSCPSCGIEVTDELGICPADGTDSRSPFWNITPLASKYQYLAHAGNGANSIVSKAGLTGRGKIYAIKVWPNHRISEETFFRFQSDSRTVSLLSDPRVVGVHEFGVSSSRQPYLIMDFIQGKTLAQLISSNGYLAGKRYLNIFIQVCEALSYAHSRGVVHGNLKPSNIFLTRNEEGMEEIRVSDFGIAKLNSDLEAADESASDVSASGLAKPVYVSPEQARGENMTQRSDLYSLGCIMYETLSGRTLFVGTSKMETLMMHMNDKPIPLHDACAGRVVDPCLERLIHKLLAKSADERYSSVDVVLNELRGMQDPRTDSASGRFSSATTREHAAPHTVIIPRNLPGDGNKASSNSSTPALPPSTPSAINASHDGDRANPSNLNATESPATAYESQIQSAMQNAGRGSSVLEFAKDPITVRKPPQNRSRRQKGKDGAEANSKDRSELVGSEPAKRRLGVIVALGLGVVACAAFVGSSNPAKHSNARIAAKPLTKAAAAKQIKPAKAAPSAVPVTAYAKTPEEITSLLSEAKDLAAQHDYAQAEVAYAAAIEEWSKVKNFRADEMALALERYADVQMALKKLEPAQASLVKSIALLHKQAPDSPHMASLYMKRAHAFELAKKDSEAVKMRQTAEAAFNDSRARIADAAQANQYRKLEAQNLDKLAASYLKVDPADKEGFAEEALASAVELNRSNAAGALDSAVAMHQLGDLYFKQGKFGKAAPFFSQAEAIYRTSKDPAAKSNLDRLRWHSAVAHYRLGQYSKAEQLIKQRLNVPASSQMRKWQLDILVQSLKHENKNDEAAHYAQLAQKRDSGSASM